MRLTAAALAVAVLTALPAAGHAADAARDFEQIYEEMRAALETSGTGDPAVAQRISRRIDDSIAARAAVPRGLSSRQRSILRSIRDQVAATPLLTDASLRAWQAFLSTESPSDAHVATITSYVLHRAAQRAALALKETADRARAAQARSRALRKLAGEIRSRQSAARSQAESDRLAARIAEIERRLTRAENEETGPNQALRQSMEQQGQVLQALASLAAQMRDSARAAAKSRR